MTGVVRARIAWKLAFAVAALAVWPGCGKRDTRPNIVLVSVDTLRADHLGSYGNPNGLTPALDALAARGVRFTHARTTAPWTLPSHASAFTGLIPTDHRAVDDRMRIRNNAPMLSEVLHNAKYRTAAFVTHYYVSPDYGFGRGFDDFTHREEAPADQMVDLATRWVRDNHGKPFFLFLHLFEPHTPYAPPSSEREKFVPAEYANIQGSTADVVNVVHGRGDPKTLDGLKALYNGEVATADRELGRFFSSLEKMGLTNTIVVLMADHGEEFHEHGLMEHGFTLFEQLLHVPFIVVWPDHIAGGRALDDPVSLVDVMPTIADLAGAPVPQGIAGRSLAPLLRGEAMPELADRSIISETTRLGPDRMSVVKGDWKYIYTPTFRLNGLAIHEQLFNLADDPAEANDLMASKPDQARALLKTLFDTGLYVKRRQFSVLFSGSPDRHKYLGTLRAGGSFVAANKDNVIMDTDSSGTLVTLEFGLKKEEKRLQFVAAAVDGDNGVNFVQEPENAPLRFDLLVDDKRDPARVNLGDAAAHPAAVPFDVPADVAGGRAFGPAPGFTVTCQEILVNKFVVNRFEVGDQIEMSKDMVERLKSLGYLDEGGAIKKSGASANTPAAAGDEPTGGPIEYHCRPLVF